MNDIVMTTNREDDTPIDVIVRLAIGIFALSLAGCVSVKAPDKPIEINLNINVRQEVVVSLKKDAEDVINANPELFPK